MKCSRFFIEKKIILVLCDESIFFFLILNLPFLKEMKYAVINNNYSYYLVILDMQICAIFTYYYNIKITKTYFVL